MPPGVFIVTNTRLLAPTAVVLTTTAVVPFNVAVPIHPLEASFRDRVVPGVGNSTFPPLGTLKSRAEPALSYTLNPILESALKYALEPLKVRILFIVLAPIVPLNVPVAAIVPVITPAEVILTSVDPDEFLIRNKLADWEEYPTIVSGTDAAAGE